LANSRYIGNNGIHAPADIAGTDDHLHTSGGLTMPERNGESSPPSVSAIITTHNRPEFLGEAIMSALSQTHTMHEVIVIDDASSVSLADVLEPFASRIIFDRLEKNSGANVARNRGVELATGEYVAFLDDDDIWHEEKTAKQLAALRQGAEACLCGYQILESGSNKVLDVSEIGADLLRRGNEICGTSGLIVKRTTIRSIGFDPILKVGQDWDIYVRLYASRPLSYVAAPLFRYRRGEHSGLTRANARRSPEELYELGVALRKHRDWLGERAYRAGLAAMLLAYIGQRPNKLEFISYAVRKAGVRAVASHLLGKLLRRSWRTALQK
jgi:glycosyltransferase involved in cell wall biosynthesis